MGLALDGYIALNAIVLTEIEAKATCPKQNINILTSS